MQRILIILGFWITLLIGFVPVSVLGNDENKGGEKNKKEGFNVSELLFHHVLDAHEWHFTDIPAGTNADGSTRYIPIGFPLPYIIYNSEKGLEMFIISGHSNAAKQASAFKKGYFLDEHGHLKPAEGSASVLDISITKSVFQMLLISIIILIIFISIANSYKRNKDKAPSGMQSFFEPVIIFVRDEVAAPNLHGKHDAFMPYLLTLFFFIWFCNLLGLTPLNSNIAGNTSFTAALALLTFVIVQFNGTKDYWQHIFWFPGVPFIIKILMLLVEFIGVFTKPFALTVRLFANIAGGHFMVLSLVSLIFLMADNGNNIGASLGIMPLSMAFSLFIMGLEFLVAAIQAYVFTLLTCVFIGQAMESHSHEEAHH